MPPKKPQGILSVVDDLIAELRSEFVTHFGSVIKMIKDLRDNNASEFNQMHQFLTKMSEKVNADVSSETSMSKQQMMDYCKSEMEKMMKEHEAKMLAMDEKMDSVQDGKDADETKIVADVLAQIPPDVEETAEETRDKLEKLQGDARLDVSAIKGIDELKNELSSKIPSRVQTPAKSYQAHVKDCSAQCDGNTKAFTIGGSHIGILGVYGTEFPQIYRPTIDYTETRNGFTLTAAISAPASGQTLICHFLK